MTKNEVMTLLDFEEWLTESGITDYKFKALPDGQYESEYRLLNDNNKEDKPEAA